jgi:regulator of PEP synthase PpsR (kinase-PPPase family)
LWQAENGQKKLRQKRMEKGDEEQARKNPPTIFVVSGSTGASGQKLLRTALAQFEGVDVPIVIVPQVLQECQIEEIVDQAANENGTIVHTFVDVNIRRALIRKARDKNVVAIDLIGRLLARLANVLHQEPIGQPGQYWQQRQAYFERVDAIEYTVNHDDGRNPQSWHLAEIVLVGISRVGKTPLSMCLAVLGWKVANVPLLPDVPLPPELFKLDLRRVVGLIIEPGQLLLHRQQRQRRLKALGESDYINPLKVYEEEVTMRKLYRRSGFAIVNVTDKPIEESADEVIALVTRRLELSPR